MSKYIKIESFQDMLNAMEFLIENELDPEIVTHCLLNGGAFTRYTWSLVELGGDILLDYMDEEIIISRKDFEAEWNTHYSKDMWLPPFDNEHVTLLSDGESWVGGIGATTYELDPRFSQHMDTCDKVYQDLDKYPLLAQKTHSLAQLMHDVGDFNSDELLTVFELARIALADANIYDQLVDDTDMTDEDMKSIQEKLIKNLEAASS